MRRIVDLTLPIEEHWRYGIKFEPRKTHENHDPWQCVSYNLESHWFTHIDYPLHFVPGGETSDDYPIEDWAISEALVLDLSWVGPNTPITAEMLDKANEKYKDRHFDTILIRTDQGKKVDWKTTDFWDTSPWITDEAGIWIRDYHPKVVGYDFPQDYEIRRIRTMKPGDVIVQPCHERVLVEGKILQMEYMNNFWKIGADVCQLICLPLNIQHADGGQIRVVAVVEE